MTTDRNNGDYTSVATEAVEWYARLRAPDVSETEAVRFRAWLAGDPARRREFDAVEDFWENLSAIEHSPEVEKVREAIATSKRWGYVAVAVIVLLALLGAWGTWQLWNAGRYVTEVGERLMVPLADGSAVMLNSSTEIRLRYTDELREVQLVHGQANFEVAKDAHRPFIVRAGGAQVRAQGTIVDVYKDADRITITLIAGRAMVSPDRPQPGDFHADELPWSAAKPQWKSAITLDAAEQVSLALERDGAQPEDVVKLEAADVQRATAWQSRTLALF